MTFLRSSDPTKIESADTRAVANPKRQMPNPKKAAKPQLQLRLVGAWTWEIKAFLVIGIRFSANLPMQDQGRQPHRRRDGARKRKPLDLQ
jgi:hypothetical protein